jgi:hypothetical protein
MIHDIPAKSRLVPAIPITNPQFVYRQARDTDVRATFARARSSATPADELRDANVVRAPWAVARRISGR